MADENGELAVEVVDARELKIVLHVDFDNMVKAFFQTPPDDAARILREIADTLDPP